MTMQPIAGLGMGILLATSAAANAAEPAPLMQEMKTASYRIDLQVGPVEQMFMQADVAAKHITEGEVMVSGNMATPKDPATARHVEVHIYSLDKDAVVSKGTISIAVTDATKKVQQVPIAKMYGIAEGPTDTHFGNNLSLPPGGYTVDVVVNGEKATFAIAVPSA